MESNADETNRKLDEVKNDNRKLEDAATSGVFMLTASMDANSLFHDAMPAANEAATNILTMLCIASSPHPMWSSQRPRAGEWYYTTTSTVPYLFTEVQGNT